MKTVKYKAFNYLIIFYVRFTLSPLIPSTIFPISQYTDVSFLLTQRPRKANRKIHRAVL
jgi:hypothetical protein